MGKFFSGLAVVILGYLLVICLLLAANTTVFSLISSKPDQIKAIAEDSGVYAQITPTVIDQLAEQPADEAAQKSILQNPDVQKIVEQAFDKDFNRRSIEPIIDGVYAWLEGHTNQPEFAIDLAPAKANLANGLADYAEKRLAGLPPCSNAQLSANPDVFSISCAPPFFSNAELRNEIEKQLNNETGILGKDKITSADIAGNNGQSVFDQFANAPKSFDFAKKLPIIFAVIGLMAAFGLYKFNATLNQGLKRLGVAYVISAALLASVIPATNYLIEKVGSTFSPDERLFNDIVYPLFTSFNARADNIYYVFAGGTLLAGLACFAVRKYVAKES